jgi:RNA polymerase subunit RPABC4/transcription elongation factor Spt4
MAEVRVTLRYSDSGTESMLLFFTRAIDAAYVGLVPYVLGLAYDLPLQVVGVAGSGSPTHAVVTKGELPGGSEPIRIATVRGSNGHFAGWYWIKKEGRRGLFIDLAPQEQAQALREGHIHAVATWEPHLSDCLTHGGRVAFRATDLPFPLLDLIVAANGPGAEGVDSLVRAHAAMSERLVGEATPEDLDYVRRMFRANWPDARLQELIRASFTTAAAQSFEPRQLIAATESVADFVTSAGLGVADTDQDVLSTRVTVRPYDPQHLPSKDIELRVGYSEDIMCVPILLARDRKDIAHASIKFEQTVQREAERIASLPDSLRESVEQARGLVAVDPALATMKMARLVELSLRSISDQALGRQPPKQISAVISGLEEAGILPPIVATSAHWIRNVRNVAAHQDDFELATASAALTHLLDILVWIQDSKVAQERRCPRCSQLVQPEWVVCPNCTLRFEHTCERCGQALETSWKACPSCGAPTVGT